MYCRSMLPPTQRASCSWTAHIFKLYAVYTCSPCILPHAVSPLWSNFGFSSTIGKRQVCLRVCQRAWASGWRGRGLAALGRRGSAMVRLAQSRAGQTPNAQLSQRGRRKRCTSLWVSRTQEWSFKNKHTPCRRSDAAVKADRYGTALVQTRSSRESNAQAKAIQLWVEKWQKGPSLYKVKPLEYYASQEKEGAKIITTIKHEHGMIWNKRN